MAARKGGGKEKTAADAAEGDRLRRERRLPEAEAAYRTALETSPDSIPVLHGLAAVLRDQRRFGEALPFASRAVALAPRDPWRHVQLGNVLGGLNRLSEAAAAYRAALDLDHYLAGVPGALAGVAAAGGGTAIEAARMFGLAAAETPEDGRALLRTAEAWIAVGDQAEAATWLRRALARGQEVAPRLARALLACGRREGLDRLASLPVNELTLGEEISLLGFLPDLMPADRRPTAACQPAIIPLADKGLPRLRTVPRPANPALSVAATVVRLAPPGALPALTPWLRGAFGEGRPDQIAVDRRGPGQLPPNFWGLLDRPSGWRVVRLDDIPEEEPGRLAEAIGACSLVVSGGGLTADLAGAMGKGGLVAAAGSWTRLASGEASPLLPALRLLRPDPEGGWESAMSLLRGLLARQLPPPAATPLRRLPPEADTDIELADALHRMPFPARALAHPMTCRRLTLGFQNRTWRVELGGDAYALRMAKFPSARWSFYADERRNAGVAATGGVGAPLLYLDEADGTMLTAFVEGTPLDYKTFLDATRVARAGELYRRLHRLDRFDGTYEIFPMIDSARRKIASDHPLLPAEFADWSARIDEIRSRLAANAVPPCPSHNDPVPYNFIETAEGLTLIDWQCAAMGDPHWEVGAFCAQIALTPALERTFLKAYFGRADHPGAHRAVLYKPVCHFYWLCTALVKLSSEPEDQLALADRERSAQRLRDCLALPRTGRALAAVGNLRWPELNAEA